MFLYGPSRKRLKHHVVCTFHTDAQLSTHDPGHAPQLRVLKSRESEHSHNDNNGPGKAWFRKLQSLRGRQSRFFRVTQTYHATSCRCGRSTEHASNTHLTFHGTLHGRIRHHCTSAPHNGSPDPAEDWERTFSYQKHRTRPTMALVVRVKNNFFEDGNSLINISVLLFVLSLCEKQILQTDMLQTTCMMGHIHWLCSLFCFCDWHFPNVCVLTQQRAKYHRATAVSHMFSTKNPPSSLMMTCATVMSISGLRTWTREHQFLGDELLAHPSNWWNHCRVAQRRSHVVVGQLLFATAQCSRHPVVACVEFVLVRSTVAQDVCLGVT